MGGQVVPAGRNSMSKGIEAGTLKACLRGSQGKRDVTQSLRAVCLAGGKSQAGV